MWLAAKCTQGVEWLHGDTRASVWLAGLLADRSDRGWFRGKRIWIRLTKWALVQCNTDDYQIRLTWLALLCSNLTYLQLDPTNEVILECTFGFCMDLFDTNTLSHVIW